LLVAAIVGFVLALGDVLDFYDAWWKFTVPATIVLGALIWVFALSPAKGQPPPQPVWPLGLDIILGKLLMTIALLFGVLGVIALVYDAYGLILRNWHIIVVALGLLAVILVVFVVIPAMRDSKRAARGRPPLVKGGERHHAGRDDLIS
jgi:hypothetical protein